MDYSKNDSPLGAILSYLTPLFNSLQSDATDFAINENSSAYIDYSDGRREKVSNIYFTDNKITTLALLFAGYKREDITEDNPTVSYLLEYPRKARFEIALPPAVHHPTMSIRFYTFSNVSLDDLYKKGMFTLADQCRIEQIIKQKKNIIISGETGSGKTTLLNAMVNFIGRENRDERIVCIEDIEEIYYAYPNFTRLLTTMSGGFDGTQAVIRALRMNPDRIIYGEVRNEAAFDLLDAWNTGHSGGMGTVHSSSSSEAIERLIALASRKTSTISYENCRSICLNAVDVVIQIEKINGVRKITEIKEFYKRGNTI